MARQFSLAGLLRLRQVQQDQAAGDLASAARHHRENSVREREARAALGANESDVVNTSVLLALAASRAASQSLVSELAMLTALQADRREAAERHFTEARARTIALEKLEARHSRSMLIADQRSEQTALDEIILSARALPGESAK